MTVSTTTSHVTLSGDGSNTVWAFPFEIPFQDDGVTPAVTVTTLISGIIAIIAPNLYTIFNVGNPDGGQVIYPLTGPALANGSTITITRSKNLTQPYAFPNVSLFPLDVEHALDNVVLEMQQLGATVAGQPTGVTSVALSGGTTGLTVSGSPVTSTGTFTLAGTLAIASGGTGQTSPALVAGAGIAVSGSWPNQTIALSGGGAGTVTSVSGSGGTTGLTLAGGPITGTGTLTLGGVLAVANGGSGVTSSTGSTALVLSNAPAITNLEIVGYVQLDGSVSGTVKLQAPATPTPYTVTFPATAGTNTYVLTTDGSGVCSWVPNGAGSGVTTLSFGTTGLTPNSATAGAIVVAGTLVVANGGTGLTSYTSGGAVYASGTTTLTSGTLPVTAGGTGAVTLSGVLKGNGTSALTAATVGTDFVAPGTATTFSATQTFAGSSSVLGAYLVNAAELFSAPAAAPASTQVLYLANGPLWYSTVNAANNFIVNLAFSAGTTLNSALSTGQMTTFVMLVTQGGTPYYCTSVKIDGASVGVTVIWQGGVAPAAGNANGLDVYTFTVLKFGSASYTVLASLVKF